MYHLHEAKINKVKILTHSTSLNLGFYKGAIEYDIFLNDKISHYVRRHQLCIDNTFVMSSLLPDVRPICSTVVCLFIDSINCDERKFFVGYKL